MTAIAVLIALFTLGGGLVARADELVQVAPHRASATSVPTDTTPPLFGYLTRPDGPGRFPAVILLHGCPGFTEHDTVAAARVKTWGYVGLALDSLGNGNMCLGAAAGAAAEMLDAYAAIRYLTSQSFVDSTKLVVMGWSMGGTAALGAVEKRTGQPAEQASIRAVVAYYPDCNDSSGVLTTPALILVGELDDWAPAAACRKLAAHESDLGNRRDAAAGTPIGLVVYPQTMHGFDYRVPPSRYFGYHVGYNETAARDVEVQVQAFLHRVLGEQTGGAR